MAEPHCPPQLGETVVLPGDVAHRAPDEVEGDASAGVRVFPGPAVARQQGRVRDGLRVGDFGEGLALPHKDGYQLHAVVSGRFPGPDFGPALTGEEREGAVGVLLGGNQSDGALVHLSGGVHHLKDAFRARHGGQQGGHLLGDLVQGLTYLTGVVEVDGQPAQVEALEDRQQSAEGGGEGVADIHQVAGHRHNYAGIEVCPLGGVPVGVVQLLELGLGLCLVGKGLYHLQSLDGLLNLSVDRAQGGLLLLIEFPAAPAQLLEQEHGEGQYQKGDKKQPPVDDQHQGHQPHEHQAAGEQ